MQLATLIVLFTTLAFNLIEGCPIDKRPPGYIDLRKERSRYMEPPPMDYPTYGGLGRGADQPDLGADIGRVLNDLRQLYFQ